MLIFKMRHATDNTCVRVNISLSMRNRHTHIAAIDGAVPRAQWLMQAADDITTDQCMIARSTGLLHNTPIDKFVSLSMSTLKRQVFCRRPALYWLDGHRVPHSR